MTINEHNNYTTDFKSKKEKDKTVRRSKEKCERRYTIVRRKRQRWDFVVSLQTVYQSNVAL